MSALPSLLIETAATLPEWQNAQSILYLRAQYCPEVTHKDLRSRSTLQQTFFPEYNRLKNAGCLVEAGINCSYPFILYSGTKFKNENILVFDSALNNLHPSGTFLTVLPNDLGAARFERILFEMCTGEHFSYSKAKARVFGVRNFAGRLTTEQLETARTESGGIGIFGADKIDAGSKLLADSVIQKLEGSGADLGGGTGYLSNRALEENSRIRKIELIEAEKIALDIAQKNTARFNDRIVCRWGDATAALEPERFDWVMSNPPFHSHKHADARLGLQFINAAFRGLKKGSAAYIVQNKHLPYLEEARKLGSVEILADAHGYLVWELKKT